MSWFADNLRAVIKYWECAMYTISWFWYICVTRLKNDSSFSRRDWAYIHFQIPKRNNNFLKSSVQINDMVCFDNDVSILKPWVSFESLIVSEFVMFIKVLCTNILYSCWFNDSWPHATWDWLVFLYENVICFAVVTVCVDVGWRDEIAHVIDHEHDVYVMWVEWTFAFGQNAENRYRWRKHQRSQAKELQISLRWMVSSWHVPNEVPEKQTL